MAHICNSWNAATTNKTIKHLKLINIKGEMTQGWYIGKSSCYDVGMEILYCPFCGYKL